MGTRKPTARELREAERLARRFPISVVIPAYNRPALLRECLQALFSEPWLELEAIVVDDGSREDLSAALRGLPPGSARVVRRRRNGGPAAARNTGLEASRHPWVFFLDADVRLRPGAVRRIRETLELYEHRPEVAGALGVYDEEIPYGDFWSQYKNLSVCFLYRITDTISPYLHTPIFCVRREVLEQAGGFHPGYATAEDFRLGVELGSRGWRFAIDRRLRGVHLKGYSLKDILREDDRRLRDLARLDLPRGQKAFAWRAHRWSRLASALIPGLSLACLALSALDIRFAAAAAVLTLLFVLVNRRFIQFLARRRGLAFALQSLGFLYAEMLWAEWCVLRGLAAKAVRGGRGKGAGEEPDEPLKLEAGREA